MNEILKKLWRDVAIAQSQSLANANAGPKYGDKSLNPDRPLTGKPEHYLTGYEGSRCDDLTNKIFIGIDFASGESETEYAKVDCNGKFQPINVEEFRKFCEEIGE